MKNNFLQVGKTIECSNCTSRKDYFADCRDMIIPCVCICHNNPEKEDWSKDWQSYVRTYVTRYCPELEEWKIISIAGNLEQVVIHNKGKFKEPFSQRQEKGINPLRRTVYERLEKMKLKDLADKINELAKELTTFKIKKR